MRICWRRLTLSHSLLRLSKPQFYPISIPSPLQLGFWSPLSTNPSLELAAPFLAWISQLELDCLISHLIRAPMDDNEMFSSCKVLFFVNNLTEFPSLILTNFGWIFIFFIFWSNIDQSLTGWRYLSAFGFRWELYKFSFCFCQLQDKLSRFRLKELKDVLSQLGLSKQGKKQVCWEDYWKQYQN